MQASLLRMLKVSAVVAFAVSSVSNSLWAQQATPHRLQAKRGQKRTFWEKNKFRPMPTMACKPQEHLRIFSSQAWQSITTPASWKRGPW